MPKVSVIFGPRVPGASGGQLLALPLITHFGRERNPLRCPHRQPHPRVIGSLSRRIPSANSDPLRESTTHGVASRAATRVRESIMDRIEKEPVRHEELRLQDMKECWPRELRRHLVAHRSTHARRDPVARMERREKNASTTTTSPGRPRHR